MLIDCSHTVQAAVFHPLCWGEEGWREYMCLAILNLLLEEEGICDG